MFQPTYPGGIRHGFTCFNSGFTGFNPRTPAGYDVEIDGLKKEISVSTHVPRRDTTPLQIMQTFTACY